jgi:xylulokinase
VPVDAAGEPLFPALIWLDRRAEAEAADLRALPEAAALVDLVANPLDAAYITPKLRWLRRQHPALYARTAQFLTSTGFIVHRLTGVFSCDYTQAYGFHCFDMRHERWDAAAADLLQIPRATLPPLFAPCARVGTVTAAAAALTGLAAGTPVIAGALDAAAGAFGSGVVRAGQTSDQGGTAFGLSLCVERVLVEPRLIFSHHVVPGTYLFQGGTVGGSVLPWFKEALGQPEVLAAQLTGGSPYAIMSQEAAAAPPGANGLLFLPYLAGERSPLWNSAARGVFFGLSSTTTRADLLRAMMEGCAFAVQHNVQVMAASGVRPQSWIGIGGAAASPVWCQIKADISNRPFTVARRADGGSGDNTLGLAVMAGHAVGLYPDLAATMESLLPERTVYQPVAERHALYERYFALYLQLVETLLPQFSRLAQLVQSGQAL